MILAHHRVNPWHKDALSVSPAVFQRQLQYLLHENLRAVSPNDSWNNIATEKRSLRQDFILTFDDGFADNYWFAFPILTRLKIPGVVFLTVGFIGTDRLLPRYRDPEKDRFLNWNEIREMSGAGLIFGSHTLSHPHLTQISGPAAREEIAGSKKRLEDKLGKAVEFFCYPYGEYNRTTIGLVQEAGYRAAVVTGYRRTENSVFTLPRVGIYGHNNFLVFRLKIWRALRRERNFFSSSP